MRTVQRPVCMATTKSNCFNSERCLKPAVWRVVGGWQTFCDKHGRNRYKNATMERIVEK